MFKWLNKQGVESTSGFTLQRMDRYFYHYIEEGRVLKIDVEPGLHHEEIGLSTVEEMPISGSERARIRANISAALKFMGTAYEFR